MPVPARFFAVITITLLALAPGSAPAVEEAEYRVLRQDGAIEIRQYAPYIIAETVVDGEFEAAGNRAFRALFGYIDGDNTARRDIAMTAPVSQQRASEKIAMTAPVSQQRLDSGWAVSFMMPAELSAETVPAPDNPAVTIRQVPAHRAVAIRYSGSWSRKRYEQHLAVLEAWLDTERLVASGEPVWARYDAPFIPWFLRRNEILIELPAAGEPAR